MPARQLQAEQRYCENLEAAGGRVLHRAVDRYGSIVLTVDVR
jgi:hypothetical protein